MKALLAGLGILATGGLLAGCDQAQVNQIEQTGAQNQEQIIDQSGTRIVSGRGRGRANSSNTTNNNRGNNNGNGRGRNFVKSDYVVDSSDNVQPHSLLDNAEKGDLSAEEKAGLIQMREEEKLAHDVYVTMYEKWGLNVFNNISGSEQTHTETIKYLLDKYGIEDPVKDTTVGKFTDSGMTKLYNSLVEQGNQSMIDALKVGATVEDLDIKDLEELLPKTDNEDIRIAYQNLNKGSRNHLRAFIRNLERNGETYTPQFISQARFDEILAGEQERGAVDASGKATGVQGNGQGNGRGQGQSVGHGQGQGQGQGMGQGNGQGRGQGGGQGQGRGRGRW